MRPHLVVVHAPVGGGHKAAALALAESAAARGLSVEVLDAFEYGPGFFARAYLTAHLVAQGAVPELYGSAYFGSNHRAGPLEAMCHGLDHVAWAGLVRRVVELQPAAIAVTHHLPLIVLGRARRKGWLRGPLLGVVTDYGAHAVWAEPGVDLLCVPGKRARRDCAAHGFDADRLRITGIPVRRAFEAAADVRDPRPGERLRVLVTSGGFGVGPVQAMIRSFRGIEGVDLTIVCGRAPGLEDTARRLVQRHGLRAEVLGFERDMPARVAQAHLVVGKAGGLTVSESLSAGRPMVLAGAVPGNETINADFVTEGGAGLVARPQDVGQLVARLRDASALALMGRRARQLVVPQAADRILDLAIESQVEAPGGRSTVRSAVA